MASWNQSLMYYCALEKNKHDLSEWGFGDDQDHHAPSLKRDTADRVPLWPSTELESILHSIWCTLIQCCTWSTLWNVTVRPYFLSNFPSVQFYNSTPPLHIDMAQGFWLGLLEIQPSCPRGPVLKGARSPFDLSETQSYFLQDDQGALPLSVVPA